MQTHWHILGAGSMGLLWAAHLHKAGHTVSLISHRPAPYPAFIEFIQQAHGEKLPVNIVHNSNTGVIQHLLICTKTWQTRDALAAIEHAIADDADIVLLQNGMANHDWLAGRFSSHNVYGAITTEAALRSADFQVSHTGRGETIIGGLNTCDTGIVDRLYCSLAVHYQRDIESALWQKLVVNCCINPLTAIYDCVNGALAENPQALQQIRQIIIECRQVAEAAGFAAALTDSEQRVLSVIQRTAGNSSSMRQDVRHNRVTEIDAINGYIVQRGQAYGIATPLNQQLLNTIKGMHYANN